MDISQLAAELVAKHDRQTQALSLMIRSAARSHYNQGVGDCIRLLQHAAIQDDLIHKTAPSAVQSGHAAVTGPLTHHEQLEEG